MNQSQFDIFSNAEDKNSKAPLAHRLRPQSLNDFIGQNLAIQQLKNLKQRSHRGIILYGPPGTGKTTFAHLIAKELGQEIFEFNAVLNGTPELRKLIDNLSQVKKMTQKSGVIFIDEIHRFNKSQQDALLPYLEKGDFLLIGATTEYPQTSLNRALISRVEIITLEQLKAEHIQKILEKACIDLDYQIPSEVIELITDFSNGDARKALSQLEKIHEEKEINLDKIKASLLEYARYYDKNSNRHYDVISAFIKSMRGSDANAALLWLAVMLDGGENPEFIARRMLIFASEDIGLADHHALTMASNALRACETIGMPEVRIILGHVVIYLSQAKKSNHSYLAINEAMNFVKQQSTIEVPEHLKSSPNPRYAIKYKYPHDYPENPTQEYAPFKNLQFLKI
jgi:putative ATPase